jgi:hypothetical protein
MPHTIAERVVNWTGDVSNDYITLWAQIKFLADKRFKDYEPTSYAPHPEFLVRLRNWLDSVHSESDQQHLFRLVPQLFFVSDKEFESLYRSAFRDRLMRWLIEELGVTFDNPDLQTLLMNAVASTWFCSITDSMRTSSFCHVNNITGVHLRPDFQTLHMLGDKRRIVDYMAYKKYTRIVILEDFVCSGAQMFDPVTFAASLPGSPRVLVIPLISGPSAVDLGVQLHMRHPHVSVAPTLILPQDCLVCEVAQLGEPALFSDMREMAVRLHPTVVGNPVPDENEKPYGPFGFGVGHPRYGGLVVLYSNTPDNTLPLIHHKSPSWAPLFPRSSRI